MSGEPLDLRSILLLASQNSPGRQRALDCRSRWDDELERAGEQHRSLVTDILEGLLREIERDLRESLARRLLDLPGIPDELLSELTAAPADDTLSALLADDDLVGMVQHRATEHRLSVNLTRSMRRRMLSPKVFDEDVEAAMSSLDEDAGDLLSAYLDAEAERLDELSQPLLPRDELDPALLRRICWRIAAAVRMRVLDSFDVDPSELDDRIEEAVLGLTRSTPGPAARPASPSFVIDELAGQLAQRNAADPRFLAKVLREGYVALFERLFCRLAALTMPQLRRVLSDSSGCTFAIACRALDIDSGDFASLYLMRYQGGDGAVRDPKALAEILRLYGAMDPRHAVQVMRQWRRDPAYVDAIEIVGGSILADRPNGASHPDRAAPTGGQGAATLR